MKRGMSSDKPPGTASPEHSAPIGADDQRLVERLCAVTERVVYFPVRHHSPAAARLLAEFIEERRPAAVLIEGPSDFQPYFAELHLPHELPIAIYSYFRTDEGDRRGAYYPFSEYSPEWQAITHAAGLGIEARFIDLPWAEVADLDRVTHRYADAELRRGRYVRAVCDRLGVEDFDDLWDKIVEADGSSRPGRLFAARTLALLAHAVMGSGNQPGRPTARSLHGRPDCRRARRMLRASCWSSPAAFTLRRWQRGSKASPARARSLSNRRKARLPLPTAASP